LNTHWNNTNRFDSESGTWDKNPGRVKLAGQIAQSLKEMVPFQKKWNALEIGCGTGLITCPIAEKVSSITAIDTSEGMIETLKAKMRARQTCAIEALVCDILSEPDNQKLRGTFDFIFSSMTLHHISDTSGLLKKINAYLHPGGYLAIADLDEEDGYFHENPDEKVHKGFPRDALLAQLKEAGFGDITFSTAATITKINREEREMTYTIFLALARKRKQK